jgi:cystine transport system substrate-binding protein
VKFKLLLGLIVATVLITCFVSTVISKADIDSINHKLKKIDQKITESQADLTSIDERMAVLRQTIKKRAKLANEQMRTLQLQNDYKMRLYVIFNSKSIGEMLRLFRTLARIHQSQNDEIQSLIEEQENLEKLRKEKEEVIASLRQQQDELGAKQMQLAGLHSQEELNVFKKADTRNEQSTLLSNSLTVINSEDIVYSFVAIATAYSCEAASMGRYSAYGIDLWVNPRVIAVDPNVIPLGTMVKIEGYGVYIAGDTGSAIIGNHIDIHFPTYQESCDFGRRDVAVHILK